MLFLMNRIRGNLNYCEECLSPIKWVYDGFYWIPCNPEPVYFYPHEGRCTVFYKGELHRDALLYRNDLNRPDKPVAGLEPHIFTCSFRQNGRKRVYT